MTTTITAVIPTKDRREDLRLAIESVRTQMRPPDELIVVDQSAGDESADAVHSLLDSDRRIKLVYIHDTKIAGLVDAKRVAAGRATCDIVSFLEDDVVLEPDYFHHIDRGFRENADMVGCSGVITNLPRSSFVYRKLHGLCFRGIFHDPRIKIFSGAVAPGENLIPCDVMSGGLSSWRRDVLMDVAFDTANGFFMLEDIEFSTRVVRRYGHRLYVNVNARLEHRWSPVNRDVHGIRQRRKLTEALVYYRKRRRWPGARRGLILAMAWWWGEALLQTVKNRSAGPMKGYFRGIADGMRKPLVQ